MEALMADAVIVAAARSPIGRAFKGSLGDLRPDDLAASIVRAALDKVPQLDPAAARNASGSTPRSSAKVATLALVNGASSTTRS
jgi:acetyl-CoA acetyltransferase